MTKGVLLAEEIKGSRPFLHFGVRIQAGAGAWNLILET